MDDLRTSQELGKPVPVFVPDGKLSNFSIYFEHKREDFEMLVDLALDSTLLLSNWNMCRSEQDPAK